MDIGGPQIVHNASPRLSEHAEEDNVADATTKSVKSTEETIHSVEVQTGQPDGTSESEKEGTDTNTEEDFELNKENLSVKDNSPDQSRTGPDVGEDTKVDKISDHKEEITNKDIVMDPDVDTQEEKESLASNLMVSTADDLDEMMDIGTVDQVEQEAQMKEEEQNSLMDVDHSHSPIISNTVAMDANSIKEEMDVKPTGLPPPAEEGRDKDVKVALDLMQSSSSPSAEAMTGAGKGSSSPANMMNGMNVVKPDTESSELKSSAPPPLVKVKEEPADDEYEQAQISYSSTASVKDEPNTAKDDLRIGSVYSVTPAAEQSLPVINPPSLHMFCSHCKKNLTKGQTAFQRKGSSALFCSTACLTTSLPAAKGPAKVCHNCQKMVVRPQDIILAPDAKGAVKGFCSQNCLTSFNHKKNSTIKAPQPTAPQSLCSMCARYGISKHEVILNSSAHKLCSDACFKRFRSVNNLSMAGCANCEAFCHVKPLMLKVQGGSKPVCNAECLAKYKEKTKTTEPCRMCHTTRLLAEMIDNRNSDDTVNLFCSSSCVMAFKVQTVSASGSRINCDSCGKNMVPAYHLAMSDTSIRNFCALPCVMSFQDKFKKSQKHVDIFTKLPVGSTQIQGITTAQPPRDMSKAQILSCSQCNVCITFKPLLIQIKDKMVFVCSTDCSYEFKKANSITSLCVNCKMDRIAKDAKRIDDKDCFFCSDGCRLIFRHEMTKFWGKHCSSCTYCHSVSKRLVTAQYGGSTEEFCSEECRSKYTMLFCHVAKCDACGLKGKLRQSLPMLGDVRNFCDLTCLLQFCCDKVATQGDVFRDTADATPIIANVISLAGPKSNATDGSAQQSTVSDCHSKSSGTIGTQTDPVKTTPPSAQKILKNKALLCRPLVQNKGISCKTQTFDCEAQTDDSFPKVMVVPIPVPVYVPVPMNMYTQFTPNPMGLPVPLPVPMFLPVTMDSAERIVETIQEIKEKIPSDPFEAELILMAEMVAEQDETNHKEERPKQKEVEKERGRQGASAPDDHASNYSDDLDTDDLASFLNNWEDTSSYTGLRCPSRQLSQEKLNPSLNSPVASSSEYSSEAPSAAQPPMDIEADISVETLERLARLREQSQGSPSPPPAAQQRRQTQRKAREKRGHKSQRLSKAAKASSQPQSPSNATVVEIPKLKNQYGVDAWKRWILWRRTQHDLEKPRFARSMEMKEDVLRCTTAELSYGLCCFINEVKRPNGESYSPDSLFYLCLGIQQHLFENGRVENIFMDRFYNKFSTEFTNMLKGFKPSVTAGGYIHSRVEEEFLWDCKQLGAYSPIVLLNTLLFFCCKYFGFTTVEQHRQLSFAHVMRCTKTNQDHSKNVFLRFYPPISINEPESGPEAPAKRRKEEENKEDILEMMENTENPLRCPVRLYEFYLSKCSESVKQRTNVFYLHPERCCVPNSPLWFSSSPLDDSTIEAMLTRILTVRELHTKTRKEQRMEQENAHDPSYTPDDENSE